MSKIIIPPFAQSRFTHSPLIYGGGIRKVAGGGLTSVSFTDSATSTAATITAPASINSGDLLILHDVAHGGASTPTSVIPSGFTSIVDTDITKLKSILSYKIADGTEDGASLTGMNGSDFNAKGLYQFRGDIPITSVNLSTVNSEATAGNPSSQNVSASGGTSPLIVIGAYGTSNAAGVDPRTFSPAKDGEISGSVEQYLAYKIYNSSPADVSIDMDDEGAANILYSLYIEAS